MPCIDAGQRALIHPHAQFSHEGGSFVLLLRARLARMQRLFALSFSVVALTGCSSEVTSFGMQARFTRPDKTTGSLCELAGDAQGGSSTRVDTKAPLSAEDQNFPHLWVSIHQAGGDAPYEADVQIVSSYKAGALVPEQFEVAHHTSFTKDLANASKSEAFNIVFGGETYKFEMVGVPEDSTCPSWP